MLIQTPAKSPLTDENRAILIDLVQLQAATPIQFELATQQKAEDIKIHLEELERTGWVDSIEDSSGLEEKVFYPSAKTYTSFLKKLI